MTPPLHVLINAINDNAQPRGPDRYLLELLPELLLADPALQVTLAYAPWQSGFSASAFGTRVTPLLLAPPRPPMARLLWQAARFPSIANDIAPDVTMLPNLIWTPGLRSPSVMTAHDLLQFRAPQKFGHLKAAGLRLAIRAALARADRVIAVSRFTAEDLTRYHLARAAKVSIILEGGPLLDQRRPGPAAPMFLFVGKLERTKGITSLIKAFRASQRLADAGFELAIVGPDGNAAAEVTAAINQHPRIKRLGFVSDAQLRHLYLSCRGFVFPSTAEGFGLVLLEAMARGAPVIAADATALPEVVGMAGLLVPPDDPSALQEAMERLAFDDALFDQLQTAGYMRLADFSWQQAAQATAMLLREVAK